MAALPVGALVLVNGKHRAVIKYCGTTDFAEGTVRWGCGGGRGGARCRAPALPPQ